MYGKLVNGELQTPPVEISRNIKQMKDAGYKPIIDTKPDYDVETEDAVLVDYVDTGIYVKAMYEVVKIELTEEEQLIEQTNKAMEIFNINFNDLLPDLTDEQALEMPLLFPKWQANIQYEVGHRVLYLGTLYKVIQAHTSQYGWEPDITPSLFAKNLIVKDDNGEQVDIPEWEQPGSTNPYMKGDKVKFEGKIYQSLIDNNVWSPAAYPQGWKEVNEVV